ncbi:MAG: hypothetical protein P4L73_14655 [Caulobacteraceae bacterium]|nr:hypothetical protein [Caulobacteraceae bacterium]
MAVSRLSAVPNSAPSVEPLGEVFGLGREPETGVQRIRRLQREARMLAQEQLAAFARDLGAMAERAAEIADGGDAYPVGARELASRLAEDLPHKAQLMTVITGRTAQA